MASINSTSTANGATVASGDAFSLAGAQDQSTDSRLGFRGTEDLGGGLRAGFVYEIGINADHGDAGNAQTRLANLSLTGGFGTVVVGTFMNAFQTVRDFNTDVSLAPGGNFMEFHGGLDGRSENAIAYISPIMNGFTFSAGAVSEDSVTTAGANRTGQEARGVTLPIR